MKSRFAVNFSGTKNKTFSVGFTKSSNTDDMSICNDINSWGSPNESSVGRLTPSLVPPLNLKMTFLRMLSLSVSSFFFSQLPTAKATLRSKRLLVVVAIICLEETTIATIHRAQIGKRLADVHQSFSKLCGASNNRKNCASGV